MGKQQTEDEILEQQRAENLAAFSEKYIKIQADIRELEVKKSNLQSDFDEHFKLKNKELNMLEEELRARLAYADDRSAETIANLKESQIRLENIKAMELSLKNKHSEHNENVEVHISSIDGDKEDVRRRQAECLEREESSKLVLAEAHQRWDIAIAKEIEIDKKGQSLTHIQCNIAEDIDKQKQLKLDNEALLKEIESKKFELDSVKGKVEFDKQEAIKIRDDCDIQVTRLAKRKEELDEKEKRIKAIEIRQEVVDKNQELRQHAINDEVGKLNQLKLDVETLLKQKEAKEAQNGS